MKNDLAAVHVLNKFIWHRLKDAQIMDAQDYDGLIPIIPTQQIPVFNNLGTSVPFIVYTYTNSGPDVDFWTEREQIVYRVYSDNERQIRQITHFLIDLLKRWDWTADEVNDYIREFSSTDGDEKKFNFLWTSIVSTIGPEPAVTEGGRQASSVTVRTSFTHDVVGTPGVSGQGMRA